ncbi:7-carboxy-7-deazaguanine synthase QueE [Bartonella sp. HY329]|uniref:7-carboxy-7-deazaguanine synthase QueE n=1 Tax=unclassified Bartonella TaxID=2645622 RepID=UPI0021C6AFB2|nr:MULTISPECIES: 7-carboxy-7-deazaguanine synthase QueE [unclassified Bartonella]UXM95400.1 7-carboxy-7-deazaguanine synthase QueE [Bartonella sp. HY329]UXN09725.1 7-carboxy-7-deazaguanine synthase QueE [Bartonella sp. HY328]
MTDTIRICEIFGPTIQGEGVLIGMPTVFVRTGGCDYRCDWCDTLYAVESSYRQQWQPMTSHTILNEVEKLSNGRPIMVSLSGGNPAIQPLDNLIHTGKERGHSFAMETQGSIVKPWFKDLDWLVLSPKPPSSKMQCDRTILKSAIKAAKNTKVVLKFVVFDDVDYQFARSIGDEFCDIDIYLQPGNHTPPQPQDIDGEIDTNGILNRMEWLIDRVCLDGWFKAHVLPQLHVLIWGNKRGV